MRKSLGDKRREIRLEQARDIVTIVSAAVTGKIDVRSEAGATV